MSIQTLAAALLATLLVLAGCSAWLPMTGVVGSGRPATQNFEFAGFDKVEIGDAFQAEIAAADHFGVEVTVDDNLVDHLLVEESGKTLRIGLKPFTMARNATLRARIALPSLASLSAHGASHATLTHVKAGDHLRIDATGASEVRGDVNSPDLTVSLSGASELDLAGSGHALHAKASGASNANLHDFAVDDANVGASGGSDVAVNAANTLSVQASGASQVHYLGHPKLGPIEQTGASEVSGQ